MLKLQNIVKDYPITKDVTVHALHNVSLEFRNNEFVSILGASGCGKTTLLNIIGGLDRYTSGDMSIDGIPTKDYCEHQWNSYRNHRIGFVFQSYNLIPHQSVVENVELALTIAGLSKEQRRGRAIAVLQEVGLATEINKKPNQLSGGQMQRVAIARALINNPEIILADEPTGALDSTTSIQVMKLLKKVAEKHLVIMVTHNSELAEQFSTRIIKLRDGQVIDDTHPYTADQTTAIKNDTAPADKTSKEKKVKMKFSTALSLSFKNLLSKKGRTVMTSLAGSIGIIGVALVLSLSSGFNMYIANLQSDTLSGYPVSVTNITADIDAMYDSMMQGGGASLPTFPEDDNNIHIYDPMSRFDSVIHYNHLTQDYLDYIESYYASDNGKTLNGMQYSYATKLNVFSQYNGNYKMVEHPTENSNMMASMMGGDNIFQEALDNSSFVQSQYDVLAGKYPTQANEIAVIVDSRNRISISTVSALGIEYTSSGEGKDIEYQDISFDSIMSKKFYVVYNNDFFHTDNNGVTYQTLYSQSEQQLSDTLTQLVNSQTAKQLDVVGVLRINPDAPLGMYSAGILYTPQLTQEVNTNSAASNITKAQLSAKDNNMVYTATTTNNGNATMYARLPMATVLAAMSTGGSGLKLTEEQAYQYFWQMTGSSSMPTSISFYTTDFEGKDQLLAYLDQYNNTVADPANKILYTDATAILSSTMGQMIDIISYVLIAFASISLVVSSVMIGIITYVSVIERTKEIGVLRSLGASKRDVSNVFNAESFLIGLTAGLMGVAITYLLCIPINAILIAVAGGAISVNLAVLNPLHALALVAISCLLTLISGSIPSRAASRVDPVKALRAE